MARKTNGHRNIEELLLEKFDEMNRRLETMSQQLAELRVDLGSRLDRVIENTGSHWRDLER